VLDVLFVKYAQFVLLLMFVILVFCAFFLKLLQVNINIFAIFKAKGAEKVRIQFSPVTGSGFSIFYKSQESVVPCCAGIAITASSPS
jgi:hypothetical protein